MTIILSDSFTDYPSACELFSTHTLKLRREKLCMNFATQDFKSQQPLFTKLNGNENPETERTLFGNTNAEQQDLEKLASHSWLPS